MTERTLMNLEDLKKIIRDIPNFPKEGIIFKDITTLVKDKNAFRQGVDMLAERFEGKKIDYVVGVESRGFIFGAALAYKLGVGFIPVRKKGKLPHKTKSVTYELEYGTDTLEIHEDDVPAKSRVLIVDDLLATGGTVNAVIRLLKDLNTVIVGVTFLVELKFLQGKEKIQREHDLEIHSVIQY